MNTANLYGNFSVRTSGTYRLRAPKLHSVGSDGSFVLLTIKAKKWKVMQEDWPAGFCNHFLTPCLWLRKCVNGVREGVGEGTINEFAGGMGGGGK